MRGMLLAGVAVLAACTVSTNDGLDVDPVTDVIGDWTAELAPQNQSGVRGTVEAESAAAVTDVSVSITGATAGARHPWHIHRGTCGSNGSIVGGAEEYPVLEVGSDGTASASADVDVALTEDSSYYVNIHRSPQELGTIVACGPLQP